MPKVPAIPAAEAIRAFQQVGFQVVRQKGSHIILKMNDWPKLLSIPNHGSKSLSRPLLARQIKDAGLSLEKFVSLL